jgi:CRP-like cAMP-binding protein
MTSQTYSAENTLAKYGQPIKNVMLIAKGEVKVFAAPAQPSQLSKDTNLGKLLMKRLPKLAVSLLGRGQIIGEMEVTFNCSYCSLSI